MERVYKKNTIMMKILPCMMIAMFVVMCISAPFVHASDDEDVVEYSFPASRDGVDFTATVTFPKKANDQYTNYFVYCADSVRCKVQIWYLSDEQVENNAIFVKSNGDVVMKKGTYYMPVGYFEASPSYSSMVYTETKSVSPSYDGTEISSSWGGVSALRLSTFDIKDQAGNVVFQKTPPQTPPQEEIQGGQETTLAPIVQETEMKPLQEILGIIPIVIVVMVGFLALRKALALLFRTLRQS